MMDTFTLELDGSLVEYALMCGFDLREDGEKAVRYGILARMLDVPCKTPDDAEKIAYALLGDDWSRWLVVTECGGYMKRWCLRVSAYAWEFIHGKYLKPAEQIQYLKDLSLSLDDMGVDYDK